MKLNRLIGIIILITFMIPAVYAEEIAADKFADLVLKTLTYDRELTQKVSGKIHIGILYLPSEKTNAEQLKQVFETKTSFTIRGYAFEVSLIEWKTVQAFQEELAKVKYLCLIVLPNLENSMDEISSACEKNVVLTVSWVKNYAKKLCLTFISEEGKIIIYRREESLVKSGIKLSAEFLKITKLI
jgi:hypothetical protein